MLSDKKIKTKKEVLRVPLSRFISKEHLTRLLITIALIYISLLIMTTLSCFTVANEIDDARTKRINSELFNNDKYTATVVCKAIGCIGFKPKISTTNFKDDKFYNQEGVPLPPGYIEDMSKQNTSVLLSSYNTIENDKLILLTNNYSLLTSVYQQAQFTSILIIPLVILMYTLSVYLSEKAKIYENANYKYDIESRLQRNLAESLHHELNQPMALIKEIASESYATFFGRYYDKETHSFKVNTPTHLSEKEERIKQYHDIFFDAIDRINSTLELVASVKKIKYNNNDASLYTLISNAVKATNSISVKKLRPIINDLKIFSKYTTSGKLTNADFLNILNILVNNAIEAKSTELTFNCELKYPYLNIYVKDNGTGIRLNNSSSSNDIFEYGVSSKNNDSKNMLRKLLNRIGLTTNNAKTVRGAGLAISKDMLVGVGGDIVIHSTDKTGTTFLLTIPIIPLVINDESKKNT